MNAPDRRAVADPVLQRELPGSALGSSLPAHAVPCTPPARFQRVRAQLRAVPGLLPAAHVLPLGLVPGLERDLVDRVAPRGCFPGRVRLQVERRGRQLAQGSVAAANVTRRVKKAR